MNLANDTQGFLDRVELMFFAGSLDPDTRAVIADVLEQQAGDATLRTQVALYMALASPGQAIAGGAR